MMHPLRCMRPSGILLYVVHWHVSVLSYRHPSNIRFVDQLFYVTHAFTALPRKACFAMLTYSTILDPQMRHL